MNLYFEVSSTEEITLALVSVKSAATFAAFRLSPIQNTPIFCTNITLGEQSSIVFFSFTFF